MKRCLPRVLTDAFGLALVAGCLAPMNPAVAAEGGTSPYLRGYKDFMSGYLPTESGFYTRTDALYYEGKLDMTLIGGKLRLGITTESFTHVLAATYVAPVEILGGTYAFGVVVPYAYANLNVGVDTAHANLRTSGWAFNLADININPMVLGWHFGNVHMMAIASIQVPAGPYDKNALVSTGFNYWSFQPQFNITWFDPKTGLEASAGLAYIVNTKNQATQYRTGDLFHVDWALGYQMSDAWKIGVVGYAEKQVTGDSGSGATLGPYRSSILAVGPGVSYNFNIGKMPLTAIAKWTHEFAAINTTHGDTTTVALSFKF